MLASVNSTGAASYYAFDGQGNTAQITSNTGAVLNTYTYLPFGEVQTMSGPGGNLFTFNGQAGVYQQGGGLSYMRERSYDPAIGRFLQPDPTGLSGGINLYAYANNNPISLSDPSGLDPGPGRYYTFGGGEGLGGFVTFIFDSGGNFQSLQVNGGFVGGGLDVGAGFTSLYTDDNDNVTQRISLNAAVTVPIAPELPIGVGVGFDVLAVPQAQRDRLKGKDLSFFDYGGSLGVASQGSSVTLGVNISRKEIASAANSILNAFSHVVQAVLHVFQRAAHDPNSIAGPSGFGARRYLPDGSALAYNIGFENSATADAPAAVVTVTQQLSSNVDWNSFQLG